MSSRNGNSRSFVAKVTFTATGDKGGEVPVRAGDEWIFVEDQYGWYILSKDGQRIAINQSEVLNVFLPT